NILDLLLVLLIAPIAEELIYRGYVLQALWQKLRPLPAAALSALLFAGSHLVITPVGFGAIFAVGFVSAYIFRWSRSLVACVVLHISYNAVVLATELLARW
ncbi:MAG TPA: CPBP family intramembrane glutamic endopeptidase, partial [Armatimonadota bacterium]|nr:CPBP family intramembrane glutamic endopeptidase [Armatimonadota bacterium]